jgi:hypothetical protein
VRQVGATFNISGFLGSGIENISATGSFHLSLKQVKNELS